MSEPLLAAALIVRDEAQHILDCLASLRGICDEVIVVDTGSTDDTPRLAEAAGALVFHRAWDNDFSAARNHGLDRVSARWVLYVDADERVTAPDGERLRAVLTNDQAHLGFRVDFRPLVGATPYREMRIWRHRPDIRFVGRMHEGVAESIADLAEAEGLAVGTAPLSIQHLGYEGDLTRKHRRNRPLLLAQLEHDPTRVYLWEELGRAEEGLGDTEAAIAAWREGVRLVREYGMTVPADVGVYGRLVQALRERGGDQREARILLQEVRNLEPAYRMGWWLEAKLATDSAAWADALAPLRALLGEDPDQPGADGIGYDRRMFGELAWHEAGVCLFHLGRYDEAAHAFDRAADEADATAGLGALEYRVKATAARSRAQRAS